MSNVYQNVYQSQRNFPQGPPVMLNPDALSPDQLHSVQSGMSARLREQSGQVVARPSNTLPQPPAAPSSGGRPRFTNSAPCGQQPPPGVLDASYYPGSFMDVLA